MGLGWVLGWELGGRIYVSFRISSWYGVGLGSRIYIGSHIWGWPGVGLGRVYYITLGGIVVGGVIMVVGGVIMVTSHQLLSPGDIIPSS